MRRSEMHVSLCLNFLIFSVASAFCQSPPPVSFYAARTFAVGFSSPYSIAVGDFNGDGKPDLAVAVNSSTNVSVLLGKGDGTFQAAVSYAVGNNPASVAVRDFNGDGRPDLVVANHNSNNVSVLLGNGDGTFQAAASYAAGSGPQSVATGDFNGDGRPDLVVANSGSNNVSVLLGNGDGTFQAAVNYASGRGPESVAVGDFNADGKLDLAVANGSGVSVLLGNGDGTFQAAVNYAAGSGPQSVATGDFNGDGKPDLVVANYESNNVSVLLGNGDGTFQAAVNYGVGTNPYSVATGDFNGDGKLDLVAANYGSNNVSVLLGNGDGTFRAAVNYGAGPYPTSVVAGDFNGDGKLDLAVANNYLSNDVSVLLGNGDGTFPSAANYGVGANPYSVATGDFNGDGNADLAVANYATGNVSVLLGKGDGTFQAAVNYAAGGALWSVAVGDFNGDGKLDLAVASECFSPSDCSSGAVSILLGNGDGTFQTAISYRTGSTGPHLLAVGDFNGDGKLDVAVAIYKANQVRVLLGNGDGTFQAGGSYGVGSNPFSVAVNDFNGDGRPDLVVANSGSNNVSVLLGNGDGTFQAAVEYATGPQPESVAVGDFNADGKLDLAVANAEGANVSVLLGNGDGTFQAAVNYAANIFPMSVTVGDFNGDGKPDLAVANDYSSDVSVLLGNGDGTFQAAANFGTGSSPTSVAVGDFNGDGRPDLATANRSSNNVSVLLNTTGHPAVTLSPTSLTFPPQPIGTTSAPMNVTLTNSGTAKLNISSITITGANSGDFAQTNNCPGSLAPSASCSIDVTFSPTTVGTLTGAVTITDNASDSPQSVLLTSTGINPGASLSPTSLSFGNQVINTTSAAKKVTLTSTGTTNLSFSGITFTGANAGDFAQTNNCPASMAPGTKCTINVTFTPSILGAESATLDVNDNAANSPQTVALSGTGVPPVTLLPASANFGNVAENDPSAPKNFTLTNNQAVTLNISSITTSNPDFAQTNTCGSSLAAKTHCTITVTFTPSILGAETATLSVTDDASNSPQTSSLSGTGIVPATLTPASANFGNVAEDTPSAPKNFTLSNKATVALAISSIATSNSDFSQTNTCGSSVAAKANCTITVTFTPSIIGAETGTLAVIDSASNSPQTASLAGTGIVQAAVSPTSLTFAAQKVGTTSAAKNVTLTNNLLTALAISSITFTGADPGDYAQTNTCGASLAAKSHCTISVTFKPTATGTRTATMDLNDSANNSPQTVSLTGTGK